MAPKANALHEIGDLAGLAELVRSRPGLHVRWSKGPDHDADERSRDHASGLELPGLPANPLTPPGWWERPLEVWLARQVTAYAHLAEDEPDHVAWVLAGRIVDRGPDNEPLLVDVEPVVRLAPALLREASERTPRSPRSEDQQASWQS